MSFRTRLISFFVLIVVVPMIAVGLLVFRLIGDSQQGKADARANGVATAAASLYQSASAAGRMDATTIARDPALLAHGALQHTLSGLASSGGLARVTLSEGTRVLADVGDRTAIAPGTAAIRTGKGRVLTATASELTANEYTRELTAQGVVLVVHQGGRTLSASTASARGRSYPRRGTVSLGGRNYRSVTQVFRGFGRRPVSVTVLSDMSATATSATTSRVVAAAFIAGFLLLAFSFSILASRALQGQLSRFLYAARRLGGGDFSSPIQTEGHDEFAALGDEFNNMSGQLAHRLDELSQERVRLRDAIRRIGKTFESNLDRRALLELALKTAMDAVQATCGRLSMRPSQGEPLAETVREGSVNGLADSIHEAERQALRTGELGEAATDGTSVASLPLGPIDSAGHPYGLITVARPDRSFDDDDRELLRSLAAQATLALENVELHFQVQRQAVTDELTGLSNHGRFQELLGIEIEQVRRYRHQVGLIMLDIDDFKSINDTYGHQQGDVVLRQVARVLRENSRDADSPARYGGEEMALILPHTGLGGAYAIAERVRSAIEALRIPRIDGEGVFRITASVGVAASTEGNKEGLIADADAALYEAKRQGKNRTVRAPARAANVSGSR